MQSVPTRSFLALAAVTLWLAPLAPAAGEATAIRRRAELEREMFGDGDVLTSEGLLARARWALERWRERGPVVRAASIGNFGWVSLGPTNGAGRFTAVAPHPTAPGRVLAGAAGGGVWRTDDAGSTWTCLTDDYLPNLSVGAIAYAPSDPTIVYLGTGEGGSAIDFIPGIGLVLSFDGGDSWILPSQVMATQFFDISVDPRDPYTVLFATDQGLLRSTDGGVTWSTPIPKNSSGRSSTEMVPTQVVRSASNPDLVYAALWCQGECPGGYSRLMKSTNGGQSWSRSATGLPLPSPDDRSLNRNAIAVAPTNDQLLYIGINSSPTGNNDPPSRVFRSTNGGASWTELAKPNAYLGLQGWYDNVMTVRPTDSNWVVGGGVWYVRTVNGGASWTEQNPYANGADPNWPHVDAHDMEWQDGTLWLANDGGVWKSTNGGQTWIDCNSGLITRQYYGLAIDPVNRERIIAGAQDNGTNRRRDVGDGTWDLVLPGDGFETAINPSLPDVVYGTVYDTHVFRSIDGGTAASFIDVSPATGGDATPFLTPLTMRPDQPQVLYTGSTRVWRSEDAGTTWAALPTDVTGSSWNSEEVWAIAVTPADPKVLMVAKNRDVYRSDDGGLTWGLMSQGAAGLPSSKRIVNVEISPWDADTAFACLAGQSAGHLYRTTNAGLTWQASDSGLPPFSVQVVRFDPTDTTGSTLFAGTDVGLYRSTDGGITWTRFGDGLPAASVHDIRILPDGSMLRVATHGRGVWQLAIPTPANRPPTIALSQPTGDLSIQTGDTVTLRAEISDPDGDAASFDVLTTDSWGSLAHGNVAAGDSATATTSRRFDIGGIHRLGVSAVDDHGARSSRSVKVTVKDSSDDCATPRRVPPAGPFPVTIATGDDSATTGSNDPTVPCVAQGAGRAGTLWFEFTPAESAHYAISTCGSLADTVLSVWTGATCGPYTAVAGGCNDDDESVHCDGRRTDSWLELDLEAGTTYRIMASAYEPGSRGSLRLNVECDGCTPPAEEHFYLVPASAHAGGKDGTFWLTDLDLYNPGATDATVAIAFLPAGGDNSAAPQEFFTVPAGAALELQDVVSSALHREGAGALRLRSSGQLVVASRTYNTASSGTFGQFIAGVPETLAIPPGETVVLAGLESSADFRTNIGVASAGATSATATVELHASSGALLATRDISVPPYGWFQVTDIFTEQGLGTVPDAYAVVRNASATAHIEVYASIVDAHTGDPTYVSPVAAIGAGLSNWIAASAHATGIGTSFWQTDVALLNPGTSTAEGTLDFYPADTDNRQRSTSPLAIQLGPGQSARLLDVVQDAFGQSSRVGALALAVSSGEIVVTSRTYNRAAVGTYGQFIAAVSERDAVSTGETATLVQLRRTAGFRSNVGLVNLTETAIRLHAEYFRADGTSIGSASYDLPPLAFHQQNNAIPGTSDVVGGFARITCETQGGSFLAYASVVDNGSDDPVFIPAVVVTRNP
jgi:photosystem II stability/assembly factor-like uncharacterized protein